METIATRLKAEVDRWATRSGERIGKEGAAKAFQRVIAKRLAGEGERAGSSYRAVLNYLNGDSEPSIQWLREAAEVLEVPLSFLVDGRGEPDRVGAVRAAAFPDSAPVREGSYLISYLTRGASEDLMVQLVAGLADAQPEESPAPSQEEFQAAASALEDYLLHTLATLSPMTPPPAVRQFFVGALLAMLAIVPAPGEGRKLSEVIADLPGYRPTQPRSTTQER